MIPNLPPNPRAELEARVTAWLLGELSAEEAARVREQVERDPELARLRERLSQTLNLLRETVATPAGEMPAAPAPIKLSAARREKLLAGFKTIKPKEFEKPKRWKVSWVDIAAAAAIVVVIAGLLLPSLGGRAKFKTQLSMAPNLSVPSDAALDKSASDRLTSSIDAKAAPRPVPLDLPPDNTKDMAELRTKLEPLTRSPGTPIGGVAGKIALPESNESALVQNEKLADYDKTPQAGARYAFQFENGVNRNAPLQAATPPAAASTPPVSTSGVVAGDTFKLALPPSDSVSALQQQANARAQGIDSGGVPIRQAFVPQDAESTKKDSFGLAYAGTPMASTAAPTHGGEGMVDRKFERRPTALTPLPAMEAPAVEAKGPEFHAEFHAPHLTAISGQTPPAGAVEPALPSRLGGANVGVQVGTDSAAVAPVAAPAPAAPPTVRYYAGRGRYAGSSANTNSLTILNGLHFEDRQIELAKSDSVATAQQAQSLDRDQISALQQRAVPAPVQRLADKTDQPLAHSPLPVPVPQPEMLTRENAFTTFSLNISDVAFKLAQASLQNGLMPEAASMRSEEFINAFDYRDPNPPAGAPIGFAWERARDPFAHNRDFVRFAIKTAAQGRAAGRPLNLVLVLDKSGSMERADRVEIISRALDALAAELGPNDTLSVVVFARTARLFIDAVPGSQAGNVARELRSLTPEGGTNLEEAMRLAYETALRHYLAAGENRVVLLTDGAANLGNVEPTVLKQKVEASRKQGIAFDCFGVGWDGYNDNLLETLSRAGNGRYGFINTPEEAGTEFAGKLAGALRVAAADVKVQVEFNPARVTAYRQVGYAKDQLKKEDFRDNNVKAAQVGAAEAGNALYVVQVDPAGDGPLGTVRVRYRVPGTEDYQEHQWVLPYSGGPVSLEQSSPAMRLTAVAASFAEWLAGSPYATEVTPDRLLELIRGVPQIYGADTRPATLESMIRQAKSISGK